MKLMKKAMPYMIPIVTGILAVIGWIACSHYEAKSYNEITGKSIRTSQAMFLQLRIIHDATD